MDQRDITLTLKQYLDSTAGNLSDQLADQIRESIASADLRPGDRLPSTRRLATDLGVSRGTVTTAVELLIAEGLVRSKSGSGNYISIDAAECKAAPKTIAATIIQPSKIVPTPDLDEKIPGQIDFGPCGPSMEAFPITVWRRCVSASAGTRSSIDYGDSRGDPLLRKTIAAYLRRARGLVLSPEQIIITNGSVHAMYLLSALYLDTRSRVVVENPGFRLAHQTFGIFGAQVEPCGVDRDGIKVDEFPADCKNIRFVYVTPSHQFPTGSRLALGRRRALIEWAERCGALIIEDDYDGEFRYDVPQLAPLAAMPNKSVVYCGTFSKTLFPGLRIGFAVAPKPLIDSMASYRAISEYAPNTILQSALAKFIDEGHYERHINRMRRLYARKRRVLAECLSRYDSVAELQGLDSGLNGYVMLGDGITGSTVSVRAKSLKMLVPSIIRYAVDDTVADNAVVMGYSALPDDLMRSGVEQLFSHWSQ